MAFLNDSERRHIRDTISGVERNTRGELVTVITRCSDDYRYIPYLWAALLALLVPGILSLDIVPLAANLHYLLQICTFLVAAVLFNWTPLKVRLIPPAVRELRAHRLAQEQFFLQNLHTTTGRTGVLLFVSVAEHYVEIIADSGINAVVAESAWEVIVERFLKDVRDDRVAEGFVTAINACGDLLAEHFPATGEEDNALPDHLVEL